MLNGTYKAATCYLPPLVLVIFLVSCMHTPNIVGKWQEPGKISSVEFGQDGTFSATDDMGMTVTGSYRLLSNGKIRFEIKHPDSSVEIIMGSFEVQGDELILVNDKDKEMLRYKKINNEIFK